MGVWKDSFLGVGCVRTFFIGVCSRVVFNGINFVIFFCFYEVFCFGLVKVEIECE